MTNGTMIKGLCVSPGFIKGRARVIQSHEDLGKVEDGEVLVLPESHPIYALAVMKAAALICENGGRLSHICVVAMEMGIPCITQAHEATQKITSGQYISLDADQGEVWIDG